MTTYKVTGPTAYQGHQPGDQFEANLDPAAERRALERGSIEIARKRSTKPNQEKEEEEADA